METIEGIGIDIGGVIAEHATLDGVHRTGGHLAVPEVNGAFDAIKRLQQERFGSNTNVISMCNERVEVYSREWLAHTNFFDRTGLSEEQLIYCRTFADKQDHASNLSINHFVDDRLEVLSHFNKGERLFLFQPRES